MSIIVQKFGGTSVADAAKIRAAAARAVATKRAGHQLVMVVSARGKKTDELVRLAAEMTECPSAREMDMLLSTGEQESVALMAMAVHELGEEAISLTGGQIGIATDSSHSKARIQAIDTKRIRDALAEGKIVIAAGFQGVDEDFNITTLGRGGSDTTATALAAVLKADECEIYTDVEGVLTTDPRVVSDARKVDRLSYDEMLELASLGAGVMHSRSIEFAKKYNVPLRVRPSYSDGPGTLIASSEGRTNRVVTGVAMVEKEVRVSLIEIPDRPGTMSQILSHMAQRRIPIDMIVQDVGSGGTAEVSFTVPQDDLADTLTAAQEAVDQIGAGRVLHGTNVSKVSVVGRGMQANKGVAADMFAALGASGVNIEMITTSEIKISVLVKRESCADAINTVHAGFHLSDPSVDTAADDGETRRDDEVDMDDATSAETKIIARLPGMEDLVVSEVLLDQGQARVTISCLPDEPGVAAAIFSTVAKGGILVDLIVQNVGNNGQTHLSFTVPRNQLDDCLAVTSDLLRQWNDAELTFDNKTAILSVRGIGLRSHTEVGVRMFRVLAELGINVQLINTSEIRVSAAIADEQSKTALQGLLHEFQLS